MQYNQYSLLVPRENSLAQLVRTLLQPGALLVSHVLFIAPTLLSFFRRPNITRQLYDNLSVEIENLEGSPGLSYCRFYNENNLVSIPPGLMCIDLVSSSKVRNMKDPQGRPGFLLCDASWYAFCNKEVVLAYIHSTGAICLPTEVVSFFSFFCLVLFSDSTHRYLIQN